MSAAINYASFPIAGQAILSIGDSSRTSPIAKGAIFTPSNGTVNNGGQCERIVVEALGATISTVLRIFRNDGANDHLYAELGLLGNTNASGSTVVPQTLEAVNYPNLFPIMVPVGWSITASINDTQLAAEMKPDSIAQAQTTAGAGYLNLNGTNVTASSTTAVAAAAAPTANTPMTLVGSSTVSLSAPALVSLTSAANLSGVNFKITGRKADGTTVTETIAGPNNATVYSANAYKAVLSIIPLGTNASTVSSGYSTVAGTAVLPVPSKIQLHSGANLSAVNFTITGTNSQGAIVTEVLAGPNIGAVTSANTYASILTISASAAVGSNVQVGTPAILSGFKVHAEGGGY